MYQRGSRRRSREQRHGQRDAGRGRAARHAAGYREHLANSRRRTTRALGVSDSGRTCGTHMPPRDAAAAPAGTPVPATAPAQAPVWPAPVQPQQLPLAGILATMPDLRSPTTIQAVQDDHAKRVQEAEASGQPAPEVTRFISEKLAQQLDQAAAAERIASPLAMAHRDARQQPY